MKKRLLVISNNVLSATNNNGKTIYSFINGLKNISVAQLFFSGEIPRIKGYSYFRISDKDIIHGLFKEKKRGNVLLPVDDNQIKDDYSLRKSFGRNKFSLLVRELLWHDKWSSSKLLEWLDDFNPEAIFFVAGDSIFAYDICSFIQERYNTRLSVYVTDDYVMPRKNESFIEKKRRIAIRNKLNSIVQKSTTFFTISQPMKDAYDNIFHRDSILAVNMADDLMDMNIEKKDDKITLIYAGSFYYGRANVLNYLVKAICEYNKNHINKKAVLELYSNIEPSDEVRKLVCIPEASMYGGSLNSEQLKQKLNMADILVFAESFDNQQIQRTKFSLSTKIPEYMSIGKPILALGPQCVGSMIYLADVALCINNPKLIFEKLTSLLDDLDTQKEYGKKSRAKYLKNHNKNRLQIEFKHTVLG